MSLQDALTDRYRKQAVGEPPGDDATDLDRLRYEERVMADKASVGEATDLEHAEARDRLHAAELADMVDDVFLPGQKVRRSLAAVHPINRAAVAAARAYAERGGR